MAYCKNCGHQLNDGAAFCPGCGTSVYGGGAAGNVSDPGGFGWTALGCCIPIVGLILYLVWKDTKPNNAKAAGKGALFCVIAYVVFYALLFLIGILASL